ncbi:hypothetical protein L6164_036335 [Bauhinia variegata]|uniref:Uncharacterized protein n=1 Tax=Bauhinia variegata TaxID=167791 RepID=A0ACB9KGT2_BAUVA|nr:hypothetical protein L6164_036335 [Bauhinia variegata]
METKTACIRCKKQVLVARSPTAYRCPVCQTLNTSFSRQESSKTSNKSINLLKYQPPIPFSSLSRRWNKRAVLCGVTYRTKKLRLMGTTTDVRNMKQLLMENFQFPEEGISVLTEHENDIRPTKKNILESLHWLVKDCQPGDSLVFHFSRHGSQQPDLKEDEIDGFDEAICPVDFQKEGMIVDNDINSILVWPLVKGVTLHAIIDACNSGTILDLTYVYDKKKERWEDHTLPAKEPMRKHTSGGLAICLSACLDTQMANDTAAFGRGMNGVLTFLFTKTIRENPEITYGGILDKIHEETQQITLRKWQPSFLDFYFPNKISQIDIPSTLHY